MLVNLGKKIPLITQSKNYLESRNNKISNLPESNPSIEQEHSLRHKTYEKDNCFRNDDASDIRFFIKS